MPEQQFQWRGHFDNYELNVLHAEAFAHPTLDIDWTRQVRAHSLGWVTARESRKLVGFVNVAWDGDVHAFILDTIVIAERRRHGIGTRLVSVAVDEELYWPKKHIRSKTRRLGGLTHLGYSG